MKKIKLAILGLVLSFTVFGAGITKAQSSLPTPVRNIIGNYDEATDYYTTAVEIELYFSPAATGVNIQYKLYQGAPPLDWSTYTGKIPIQRRGNYRLEYRSYSAGDFGETQAVNIRVNIPIVETYPNVIRDNKIINHGDTGNPIVLPEYVEKDNEIRGVWVSTVSNIDIGRHTNDEAYKNEIISILNRVQSLNMNTVFFQVRSMNDAMYPSELAPYSRYLKGSQGTGIGWDVLEFVLEEAHKRGLELHAWMNPYRVADMPSTTTMSEMLGTLHEDNFAKQNPHLVLKQSNAAPDKSASFILDPGRPEVINYLNDVIEELLENYPEIDGIHFDDYFYVTTNDDANTYANYNPNNLNQADWRRNNVDRLVEGIYDIVTDFNQTYNKKVKFGISPTAVWANKSSNPHGSNTSAWQHYSSLYCDTRKWIQEEWLHYIVPQLYFDLGHNLAAFEVLVDWWSDVVRGTDVQLLIGLGFYRFTDNDPWTDSNAIPEQLRYMNQHDEVTGHVTFSYRTFNRGLAPITQTLERLEEYYWTKPVDFTWESDVEIVPIDDASMKQIKEDFGRDILSINNYIADRDITSDKDLEPEEMKVGEYFTSEEALEAINVAINKAQDVIDNRFSIDVVEDAILEFEDAVNLFKSLVYEGRFDPNRGDAVNNLQRTIDEVLVIRNLVQSSEGKTAAELPKGEYFADPEVLDQVDAAILDAQNIIADEGSISSEINAVFYDLKDKEDLLRNSYFQGEKVDDPTLATVKFDYGYKTESVTVTKNQVVNVPETPVKEGYNFVGWYIGNDKFDFNSVITEDIVLVAKYEEALDPETVTVKFDYGYKKESVTVTKNETVAKPETPSKEGYSFLGWYLNDDKFDFNTAVTTDLELVAKYQEIGEDEPAEVLGDVLETLNNRVSSLKISSSTNPEELRKDHQFVSQEKMDELKALILEAEELLEDENASLEDILNLINRIEDVDEDLSNHITIGELESNYRRLALFIGSAIAVIAVVGGIVIFVLLKKRR